ncbi:bifunctional 3-phenylpropionate/cinnamic acid dioxygenase ferredoxin subunit [Streptosporangium sp. KLBMP 9127]|nr:bifunctional 3-phenylpropionate/cinnamic acid dioxygenase ferredoxin subunit [Streptosporangium sp. KLBMP 9127]
MSPAIRVAPVEDIAEGEGLKVDRSVTGTADHIAVLRDDDGEFYALDDTCTHEEASLAEGWIENGQVECPLHAARFCLRTGAALCLPATRHIRRHQVEVRDGEIWLLPDMAPVP